MFSSEKGDAVHDRQLVDEMAVEILARQARARSERTGETSREASEAVMETEAGRLLGELRDGSHHDEGARQWQRNLPLERARERSRILREKKEKERAREREEERVRALQAAWESFMRVERRELALRKDGQLAKLLGEALPGEPRAVLSRLASEDQRQAEEGLVALMSNGTVFYKRLEELSVGDMPARGAANRLRMTWLKERHDGWLVSTLD